MFLSFSRAVMREDDLVFFVSFYPSKTLFVCPFLNARVRFFRKRASSSSGTFYDDAFRREGREDQ